MTEEEKAPDDRFDELIKSCLQYFPGDLASWLLGNVAVGVQSRDSVLATASKRYTDTLLEVPRAGRPALLLHVEFQLGGDAEMPERMAEYAAMLVRAIRSAEEHRGKSLALAVVYLDRKAYREDPGHLDVKGEMGLRVLVSYRVVKLWEVDPAPILAMGSPGLLPFVPFMRGNPEELIVESTRKILAIPEALAGTAAKSTLLMSLGAIAGRVIGGRELLSRLYQEVLSMGENRFFDLIYEKGEEAGRKKGCEIGREEGREEGARAEARRTILRILRRRFGTEGEGISDRLERVTALHDLESLIDEATDTPTLEGFLRHIPAAASRPRE